MSLVKQATIFFYVPYLRSTARDLKKWTHHSYEGLKIMNSNMIKICLSKLTDGAEKQLVAGVKKVFYQRKTKTHTLSMWDIVT